MIDDTYSPELVRPAPPRRPAVATLASRGLRRMRDDKLVTLAVVIWVVTLVAAAFPSLLAPGDPNAQNLSERLLPPLSSGHLLGTNELGQGIYTRLVYGARTSVVVAGGAVLIGGLIGTAAGIIGGYFRRARPFVGALIDVQMAFPGLLLVLAIVVLVGKSNVWILALILGLTGWAGYARILRGQVMAMREQEFVRAARASGASSTRIMARHLLPNLTGTLSVLAVLDLSRNILSEAAISFVGLGIQPPHVSWGVMLETGREFIYQAWWLVTFPGVVIALVVLAANLIANDIQARVDPTQRLTKRA